MKFIHNKFDIFLTCIYHKKMIYYIGYIFLLPIMYMFLEKMNSMHQYHVRETCDAYLLCERVEDIETTIKKLQQQITILNTHIENLS